MSSAVFSFEFGTGQDAPATTEGLCLTGKYVNFRSGWLHDAIYVNGCMHGRMGGGLQPATKFDEDTTIATLDMGVSLAGGVEGTDTMYGVNLACIFGNLSCSCKEQKGELTVGVGGWFHRDKERLPSYEYVRERLGLQLWVTSVTHTQCPFEYGFVLSALPGLSFDEAEFRVFWNWLVTIKHTLLNYDLVVKDPDDQERPLRPKERAHTPRAALEEVMEPQRAFLIKAFTRSFSSRGRLDYFYQNHYKVSISYGAFAVVVSRCRDGARILPMLFVNGTQYDVQLSSYGSVPFASKDELFALAIATALKDSNLLHEMGLLNGEPSDTYQERDLERMVWDNERARQVVLFLVLAGIRILASTEVVLSSTDAWDVYKVAAGSRGWFHSSRFSALVCAVVQVLAPALLLFNAAKGIAEDPSLEDEENNLWLLRVLFLLYAFSFEYRDRSHRGGSHFKLTVWLCAVPEFSTALLIAGFVVNAFATIMTTCCMGVLLLKSTTSVDIVLNALALYFIRTLDDEIVAGRHLDAMNERQVEEVFRLKTVVVTRYAEEAADVMTTFPGWIINLSARASFWTSNLNMVALLVSLVACLVFEALGADGPFSE